MDARLPQTRFLTTQGLGQVNSMKQNILMGQRFLRSRAVRDRIIAAAELSHSDTVLEVGPGDGFLTEALAAHAGRVIAVEKDARFAALLKEKFKEIKNVEIVEGDMLKFLISNFEFLNKSKIVANIPYYITSRFLRQVLEAKQKPELMVLMVQKEVADRMTAKPPYMNMLALAVQAFGKVKRVAQVPARVFTPPPRVDSAIIKIFDISGTFFEKHHITPEQLFSLSRRAFAQKRKMLSNSIGLTGDTRRPQELSLEDWACLTARQAAIAKV